MVHLLLLTFALVHSSSWVVSDATRVSRLMLDCRGFQIGGGTVEIMVHIAGRGILKEYAKGNQDEL